MVFLRLWASWWRHSRRQAEICSKRKEDIWWHIVFMVISLLMYFVKVSGRCGKDRAVRYWEHKNTIASIPIQLPGHVFSYLLTVAYIHGVEKGDILYSLITVKAALRQERWQSEEAERNCYRELIDLAHPIHHLRPPAVFDEDVGLFCW